MSLSDDERKPTIKEDDSASLGAEIKEDEGEVENGEERDLDEVDEDEDEEDYDDDDDYDDDIRSHKKSRRNKFIDDIAEVSEDEEEEEDEEEAANFREEFIADHEDDDVDVAGKVDTRVHQKYDRAREKENDENMEAIARDYKKRYGKLSQKYRGDRVMVSQKLLMPSVNDPNIWAIRCSPGKEIDLIRQIMKKKASLEMTKNPLEIFSAFQRDNFTGYIYVEARKIEAVNQALKGLVNILTSRSKLLVPVAEYPDLLRPTRSNDVEIVPGIYVRIKRGLYKNDLAIVEDISENGLEVLCKVVPRLDYGKNDETDINGKRKRGALKVRPPPRLFSQVDAKNYDMKNPVIPEGSNSFRYKNEHYRDGFLYKDFKIQYLQTNDVNPSLSELSRFNVNDEGIDLSSISQSLKQSNQSSTTFQPGDRIEVVKGEQKGVKGFVSSAERNDVVSIKIDSDDAALKGRVIEIPASNIRKIFATGDHVRIIHGKHVDDTGLVLEINNHQVTLFSDQTQKDITVFSNYLIKSTDSSSNNQVGEYELHDLVQLNSQNFGIIIKADREVFTVLCQDGRTVTVTPSSISHKINLLRDQTVTTDANGIEIKVGDTVKEKTGERRQGSILHVFKSTLFLKSKTIIENKGIFVTSSTNVTTISTKGTLSSVFKAPDLSKMNPSLQIKKGESAPVARTVGRDKSINQRITINSGPYKTLQGIVKDANGNIARVELHSKNKIISIEKRKLSFHNRNGQLEPYEKWIMNNTIGSGPRGSSVASGGWSGAGGASVYGSNGNKSSWSNRGSWYGGGTAYGGGGASVAGGRTAYGGGSTAYGGSRTPAWSSAAAGGNSSSWGGNKTSYGSGSAWGGNKTSYGSGSAWGGNKTSYGGGTAYGGGGQTVYGGGGTAYGGSSAWNPNHGSNEDNNPDDDYDPTGTSSTPWTGAPTPGISAPTPGAPTPGGDWTAETPAAYDRAAPTPGGYNYDDNYDPYDN